MALRTADCVKHLIEWTVANRESIPIDSYWVSLGLADHHLNPKNWYRRGIKKHDNKVYRLFECPTSSFKMQAMFLVIAEDDVITSVTLGTRDEFKHHFNKTDFGFGWS